MNLSISCSLKRGQRMKSFLKLMTFLAALSFFYLFGGGCSKDDVLRLKDEKTIHWDQMIQEIKGSKIVLVGELHDEPKHHEYQLRIIEALHNQGSSLAIGLEMFRANNQASLDRWVGGNLSLEQFLPIYSANWPNPWSLYQDIFLFSKEMKVPLIGLNVPPEIPAKVVSKGFSSLSQDEIRQLPPGITCNVDETYMGYIKRIFPSRPSGNEFVHYCEAQLVWDNAMALHTVNYLETHPGATVIILTGWDHAWKRAIPRQIDRLNRQYTFSVILPELVKTERDIITAADADFLILR
jgi:uncharacterized iron-regulated protein